jgi:hypothetical protein
MTTDRQMARAYACLEEVIAALCLIGELDLAERLGDCATTRFARHSGTLPGRDLHPLDRASFAWRTVW